MQDLPDRKKDNGPLDSLPSRLAVLASTPNDWALRKSICDELLGNGDSETATNILWAAPQMPYHAEDVAFSVKVLSKHKREDAIRLLHEVVQRSAGNASACLLLAKAFYDAGLPLIASRFYGGALAVDTNHFDLAFEEESLWSDDHEVFVAAWEKSGYQPSPAEPAPMKKFLGKAMSFMEFTQRITACSVIEPGHPVITKEEVGIKTELLE